MMYKILTLLTPLCAFLILYANLAWAELDDKANKAIRSNETDQGVDLAEEIASPYRTSWALLIGINKYLHLSSQLHLDYAVKDVDEFEQLLIEEFEFPITNVTRLTDERATKKNILKQLSDLVDTKRIERGDRILVFFSGHGQTVPLPNGGEMGYLIPYDAEVSLSDVGNPGQYYETCISMDEFKRFSKQTPAKHVLFLVDSCYSGLAAESRGGLDLKTPGLLQKVAKLPVRHIITAGRKGEKVFEKAEWGHGAFTYKLLEALKTGASDWNNDSVTMGAELATYLLNVVPNIAPQTPHQGRFEGEGEFMFVHKRHKKQPEPASPSPIPLPPASDSERPQIQLIEPSELRGISRDLHIKPIIKPTVSSVKIVGIVTDNVEVVSIMVDGRSIPLTAAVERDLQLVSTPVLPNYKTMHFEAEIDVSDGKPREVKIEAKDAAGNSESLRIQIVPSGKGTLLVNTTPIGAAIYIDGRFIDHSPKIIKNLPAGQRRVRLVLPGKPDYEKVVTIRDGETEKLKHSW